MFGKDEEMYVG